MFDRNGNGKHDAFDDFVTFGLVHHIIEDSKKMNSRLRRIIAGGFIVTMIIPTPAVKQQNACG